MSLDTKTYSYNNQSFMALCFAFKAWVACVFFILQAFSPNVFTCISTGIIKDIAYELESNIDIKNNICTSTKIETNNESNIYNTKND